MSQNSTSGSINKGSNVGITEAVNNNNIKQMAYRNLINENGYHSLLGGDRETIAATTNIGSNELLDGLSAGQLIDRMNKWIILEMLKEVFKIVENIFLKPCRVIGSTII